MKHRERGDEGRSEKRKFDKGMVVWFWNKDEQGNPVLMSKYLPENYLKLLKEPLKFGTYLFRTSMDANLFKKCVAHEA